jgi:hypothetical protein
MSAHALVWRMRSRTDPYAPAERPKRAVAYPFVLDQLAALSPTTRAMFGATAVYLDERVVFLLRKKGDADDGVWLSYEPEVEAEVLALLPRLQRIEVLGNVRCWRKLAASSDSFEDDVMQACKLLRAGDTRLGKLPDRLKRKSSSKSKSEKKSATKGKMSKRT